MKASETCAKMWRHGRRLFGVGIAGATLVAVGAMSAQASRPAQMHACVAQSGLMRLVDKPSMCGSNERPVSWGSEGPMGPAGAPGPQGQPGEPGGKGDPAEVEVFVEVLPALAQQQCAMGSYVIGFDSAGGIICSGVESSVVGADCGDPGPGADLRNCDLRGLNGQNINLAAADLRGADLRLAELRKPNFSGANLAGANLRGAYIHAGNFSGATLDGADLAAASVDSSVFWSATLRGASLRYTNVQAASFLNADLAGADGQGMRNAGSAKWHNTYCPDDTHSAEYKPETCVDNLLP